MSTIQADSFLTLHYRLAGDLGDVVNTFGGKPATLTMGTGELSPTIEKLLIGLNEGDEKIFSIEKGLAFGERAPEMIQWLSAAEVRDLGDTGQTYQEGEVIDLPTPDGAGRFAARICAVAKDGALQLDFNHPLADKAVTFEVKIIGVL